MLPKMLYELLPYMYLSIGYGSGVAIDSMIVFVAGLLLMATGILVLTTRITFRFEKRQSI
jgi:hypothetical protein